MRGFLAYLVSCPCNSVCPEPRLLLALSVQKNRPQPCWSHHAMDSQVLRGNKGNRCSRTSTLRMLSSSQGKHQKHWTCSPPTSLFTCMIAYMNRELCYSAPHVLGTHMYCSSKRCISNISNTNLKRDMGEKSGFKSYAMHNVLSKLMPMWVNICFLAITVSGGGFLYAFKKKSLHCFTTLP